MEKLIKRCIIIGLLASITLPATAGGPWTQKKGEGYFKLSEYWLIYNQHYTDLGLIDPNVTTGIFNTSIYGEYGITDRVTATLFFPFFSRNYTNNIVSKATGKTIIKGDALNSIGDSDIGIKYSLTKPGAKFPIAASLVLGVPLGKDVGGVNDNLQTGDGEFNQILNLDAGRGLKLSESLNSYASINLGFNNRTNNFSDELRYGIELGVGIKNKLWLIGRMYGVESLRNGAVSSSITSTGIFANNTEFLSVGFEAAYYVSKRFGVSASITGAVRGEIIAAAPAYNFGFFYDMSK
jgi:hypothetical protein